MGKGDRTGEKKKERKIHEGTVHEMTKIGAGAFFPDQVIVISWGGKREASEG